MDGAEVAFNHADYRLVSSKMLYELANFKEGIGHERYFYKKICMD